MDLDKTILDICNDIKNDKKTAKNNDFGQDQDKNTQKNMDLVQPGFVEHEKRGRKNKGFTNKHYLEFKDDRKKFREVKQPNNFNSEIVEHVQGEIIQDDNIKAFAEMYKLTCYSILDNFLSDNIELTKKHPYTWYKKLLLEIKKNVPAITYKDIDKIIVVWDILSDLLDDIGLYITYETFEKMTKIYKYQLENMQKVNPKYIELCKKINKDCDTSLINELQYNPYNQTNKMFIAKVHGIIEKTEPKTIEVNHNIKNYDNISNYRLSDNQKN